MLIVLCYGFKCEIFVIKEIVGVEIWMVLNVLVVEFKRSFGIVWILVLVLGMIKIIRFRMIIKKYWNYW